MSEISRAEKKESNQREEMSRRRFLKYASALVGTGVVEEVGDKFVFLPLVSKERKELPPFFNPVLERLNHDFWLETGDDRWMGDMMHDAPSFAPFLLYRLGQEKRNQEYIDRANRTVEQEIFQIDQVLKQIKEDPDNKEAIKEKLYPAVMGHIALVEGLENYSGGAVPKEKLEVYSQGGILLANLALILGNPEEIDKLMPPGFNRIQAFAFAADADFQLARIAENPLWIYLGTYLTEQMIDQFWTENNYGGYFSINPEENLPPKAWDQGYSLVGLAGAYAASRDTIYLNKKRAAVKTILTHLRDSERGGFFNTPDKLSKHLSANTAVAKGLIRWKKLDRVSPHDDEIQQIFNFFQNDLLKRNLLWHHWDPDSGRANYFCTGCNFFALDEVCENSHPAQLPFASFGFDIAKYQDLKRTLSSPEIRNKLELSFQKTVDLFTPRSLEKNLSFLSI